MDLICSLFSWWEGFGSSSLITLPLGFNCSFISTSACGPSTGVCSWGCPGGLGSVPVRARCGGGMAAWVSGVLAARGTQGSWQLGQQEIQCSRRVWEPVLANTLQYSCLENPPTEKPGRPQSTGPQRVGHDWNDLACPDARLYLPVAAPPQWGLTMKVVQLLVLWGPWQGQVCRDMDCLHSRSYCPTRVLFWAIELY